MATRRVGAYTTTVWVLIFGVLLSSLYIPFALQDLGKITLPFFLLNMVLGTAYLFGNFLVNQAFRSSNASVVGIIIQSFPAIVLILSALIFRDTITAKQVLWICMIFLGVFLCSFDTKDMKNLQLLKDYGIRLALIATFIFSIYFTFLRVFTETYNWFWPNYISFLTFPLALWLVRVVFKNVGSSYIPQNKSILVIIALSALLLRAGDIALNYGIGNGFSSLVAPIAGASPTLFVVLSYLIFKDPIKKQQKLGIGISLIGIVLLSFFSA